jgi:uncharacterized protein (TIGR00304 family)
MNKLTFLSLLFLLLSFVCFLISYVEGDLQVGMIIIIPFILGSGYWSVLGVLFFIFSIFLFSLNSFRKFHSISDIHDDLISRGDECGRRTPKSKVKLSGLLFIGPIPIVFGNNKKSVVLMIMIGLIFLLLGYTFYYFM